MNNYEEQLKNELKIIDKDNRNLQQENIYLREKCKELQIIVKEVRECVEELVEDDANFYGEINRIKKVELLEILDKVGDEK